jgi:rhamnogalacturonyl hydrolase YesR
MEIRSRSAHWSGVTLRKTLRNDAAMRRVFQFRLTLPRMTLALLAAIMATLVPLGGFAQGVPVNVARPVDNGAALVNPRMGWTMHFYSNVPRNYGSELVPSDTLDDFPGLSTVYLRLPWAYLEPEEGKYNWAVLDTPAQRWIAKGKRIALRITCSENWMTYATPQWVKDAGAKGSYYQYGKGRVDKGGPWDPFFDDPVFMEKLERFMTAYAARYDGNPNVEFIDVGTYGLWGEGHTHASSRQDSIELQKRHIDLHLKHFKKTLLCISDDFAGHDKPGKNFPITDYAFSRGVTIRDDSILVQPPPRSWYHAEMAQLFWPKMPVILEHEHYDGSKQRGAWSGELLLKAVEDYHASFMSIHGFPKPFLEENRVIINAINQRLGYRIMPVELSWPATVPIATAQQAYTAYGDVTKHADPGKSFKVRWSWANKGVAPCYPGGFPALTLKDQKGGIVSVLVDEKFNMRDLKIGEPGKAPVTAHESEFITGLIAPTTRPGNYDLYLSIGARDGTPKIAMPLEGDDGQRRYRMGSIQLEVPGSTAPISTTASAPQTREEILKRMRKAADYQISAIVPEEELKKLSRPGYEWLCHNIGGWRSGAFHLGLFKLWELTRDPGYMEQMIRVGKLRNFTPVPRMTGEDDLCIGQMYLRLHGIHQDPNMLAPMKEAARLTAKKLAKQAQTRDPAILKHGGEGGGDLWSFADALFMAPPNWAHLIRITGDPDGQYAACLEELYKRNWDFLFDTTHHLYYRDTYFIGKKRNERPIFWGRGNGWVMGSLALVLEHLPENHPLWSVYAERLRLLAKGIAACELPAGGFGISLMNQEEFPEVELSSTALIAYGLTFGLNRGILPKDKYQPIVERAWKLVSAMQTPDGAMRKCQQGGTYPERFKPENNEKFGTGAYLLFASEYLRINGMKP